MSHMQRTRYLLIASISALAVGVIALLVLLLRQGSTHDRVLMEYSASQALSAMIDTAASAAAPTDAASGAATEPGAAIDNDNDSVLPENVVGFGVYTVSGEAVVRLGSAPRELVVPADRGAPFPDQEHSTREGTVLKLVRAAGSRGAFSRGGGGFVGQSGQNGRLLWLIEYDVSDLIQERQLRVAVIVGLFLIIAGFFVATVILINTVRRAEVRSRQTEALAQLGAAARTITHEIKNPLASIRLQTSLLRRVSDNAERVRETVDVIDDEVQRLSALAEGVRSFLGDPKGSPQSLDVCAAVRTITKRQPFSVDVVCNEQPDAHMFVLMDPLRFDSVVTNLCANAWQAQSDDGPPIEVHISLEGRMVSTAVLDRGTGVSPEVRERIFDPFFTTRDGGSGVGLATAQAFVQAADGRISIDNREGGGAVARVVLPMAAGETT
jgi:two-component system sensor histidine kinase HydH